MINDMAPFEQLIEDIETKFGKPLLTNKDYVELCYKISKDSMTFVSVSTLKRYWKKKDNGKHVSKHIRQSTLDVLAHYIGYDSYCHYENHTKENPRKTSHALKDYNELTSADIEDGARILLKWSPDREVIIEHINGAQYVVKSSVNSKLRPSDTFEVETIIEHAPLLLQNLQRGTAVPTKYICGQDCSLTIELLTNDKD